MNPEVETIWNQFKGRLDQFIRQRVENPSTAEDIVQEVFLKLQRKHEEFRDLAKLQGWLFLVARNAVIDHYRTRKPSGALTEALPAEFPANETEEQELKTVFHRLLQTLPAPYRDALVLTEFEGLSLKQLAQRLGVSISGAKSRVQRARDQLKELLLDYCHEEFGRAVGSQPCPKGLLPIIKPTKNARTLRSRPVGLHRRKLNGSTGKKPNSRSQAV